MMSAPLATTAAGRVCAFALAFALAPATLVPAQATSRIPLVRGLTVVQTLQFPEGDRESVIAVDSASAAGVRYAWRGLEAHTDGDTTTFRFARFVSAADLARAERLRIMYEPGEPLEHPSYTSWSISTAVYRRLRSGGSAAFQIMSAERPAGAALAGFGFGARAVPVRWRGTLTRVSAAPEPFPLLVNGRRVTVPALHLRGQFSARERAWAPDIWVLADSAFPMILKWLGAFQEEGNVLQTIRVDLPDDGKAPAAIEGALASAACRVELPGIYFGFNSAALDPASERTLASVAGVLARHPDWQVTIEGHTDSIGSVAANRALSERRVEAVRQRLVTGYRVDAHRLRAVGYGRSRPRESNATIEGRARNRRVELARDCAGQSRSR